MPSPYRVGIGYDIHRLMKGRPLILGGIKIPYPQGLDGHSDADVVLHAVADALLGAIGQGDIGEHFPSTDIQYKDIASVVLLERVYTLVAQGHYAVGNVDVVIQAEQPHLKSYKSKMITVIAKILHIDEDLINIKATTNEGLGAIGQGQGIACWATVLLERQP